VEQMRTAEYGDYFPTVAAIADDILQTDEVPAPEDAQLALF